MANSIFATGHLARLVTPQVISKIGVIEIQPGNNQWQDLVMGLVGTAARADIADGPREASLKALGFLLEELDEYDESPLSQQEVDAALTAICGCMAQSSTSVQYAAVNAMYDTLPFVAENFEDAHAAERNAIMMAICSATQNESSQIKISAFQCIGRIAQIYYDRIADYIKVLAELTATAARSKDEELSCSALEFWNEIASEEADRRENGGEETSKKYILTGLKPLVEMLFEIMCQHKAEEEDDWGPLQSAHSAMQKSARAVGHDIVDVVMPHINANFSSPDPLKRDAAVMCFALIMEGPDKGQLQTEIIMPALPHILSKLEGPTKDPSAVVRSSSAYALQNIFSEHLEVLAPYDQFVNIVNHLCKALEDEPTVVKYVCTALDYLIKGMHDDVPEFELQDGKSSMLSPIFYHVINSLMTRADQPDWYKSELRSNCYLVITSVIEAATEVDETILLAFLGNCLQRLNESSTKTSTPTVVLSSEEKTYEIEMQGKLCGMVQEILLQIKDKAKPAADSIASIMARVATARMGAENDAITCLSSLTLVVEKDYERYMPTVFQILRDALNRVDDATTCKHAIMAMGDVARALSVRFEPIAGEITDILKKILINQEVSRSLKPPALAAFADIALALGPRIEPYMTNIMFIISSAAKTFVPTDDEDLLEFFTEVRKSAIEAWSALFLSFAAEDGDNQEVKQFKNQAAVRCLAPSLSDLRAVIVTWASDWKKQYDEDNDWRPDFALLQDVIQVLGDCGKALPKDAVQPYLNKRLPEIIWLAWLEESMNAVEYPEDEPLCRYMGKFLPD